jgi:tyrosine-specific transport protein
MSKDYLRALGTLVGTIIGVGIFSIPFVASKAGMIPLLVLLPLLGFAQHLFHKFYAEIILAEGEMHRLPGYTAKYFGENSRNIVLVIVLIASYGGLLAYIILSGIFINSLLEPIFGGSPFIYSSVLFLLGALIVFFGLKLIAGVELYLSIIMVLAIILLSWRSFNYIDLSNFSLIDWRYALLPYGPIFFSVGGDAAIPEVCRLLGNDKKKIKSVVRWGTFIPVAVTFLFVVAALGVTGVNTTPDTLVGLRSFFSPTLISIALVLGLLAVFTSFLTLAQATKEIFIWDFKIKRNVAWFLALVPPYLLYLIGLHNLTSVVSFTGSVMGGILGVILIWLFFKVKNGSHQGNLMETKLSKPMAFVLSLLFVIGFIYSLFEIF